MQMHDNDMQINCIMLTLISRIFKNAKPTPHKTANAYSNTPEKNKIMIEPVINARN